MKAEQQAFVDTLLGRGDAPAGLIGGERGLAAYRNNLRALAAQALAVPFSRLREALGDDEFASLAWTFWRVHPPESGDLGQWGDDRFSVGDWLLAFASGTARFAAIRRDRFAGGSLP